MEQGNRGRGRASVRQRWMAARARTGGGVSTRSGNVNRRGRGPAYPPNDAVDGQWAVVAEDAGSEPVMIQEEVHDDNDYGGDDRHGDDFCEQRMYEQYGEEYREQYGDGYEGDGSDESSTASSPTYDSPEQISTSAEDPVAQSDHSSDPEHRYTEQTHQRALDSSAKSRSRKRQRSQYEAMQDEKTPDAAVIGQMFSSMVKIIKKTSSFERKLQKMVEEARSLSTEASDVCEALMSSDSFPSQVNAQEIRILLDFRQEAGRGEDADRAQTPENPSKRRFTPPTPLSSRDSHSDREYPRSPRVRSSVVSEQSALGSSPTYDGSDGYASGVTATTGDHLEHIEEAPVAQTTQNKEIDLSQIAEYNQGGTAPSAKRSRYDDPHYMYSPCSNCALVNLACDGNPGIVCSACLTDHPNSYCIYEPAHRKPKWKMSEAQLLAITSNPFREPVVIGGRRYQKTDAEWDGIQENQKRKYLKCLEIEGAGGVDASPPCGECVKAGVRCRAPAPETSYGKQNKNNLAKGNAQCARCRLVGKSAACSLILRSPAKCSPSGAGSKEDGLGQPSTVDGGQLGLGDPRSDESMPFPTSTPTPEDVGLLFEEWIPDLGPGFEFF